MNDPRHELAGAFADIGYARMALAAGDREECALTLHAISAAVASFKPASKADAFTHRKVTVLLDSLLARIKTHH